MNEEIVNVAFYCGYAEITRLGLCVFSAEHVFDDKEEAFDSLAGYLLDAFLEDSKRHGPLRERLKQSKCNKNHEKVKTDFCPDCGQRMVDVTKIPASLFIEWLFSLPNTELHRWPYEGVWSPYFDSDYGIEMISDESGELEIAKRARKYKPEALDWDDAEL